MHADQSQFDDSKPAALAANDRRMQVRAYNYWYSLLGDRDFPSIDDLKPADMQGFAPFSVLMDFSAGREDPALPYVGNAIRDVCALSEDVTRLSQVPEQSLLGVLAAHYERLIDTRTPVGFESPPASEHVEGPLYRGILMPFSSDDRTIDFVYSVISWKTEAQVAAETTPVAEEAPDLSDLDEPSPLPHAGEEEELVDAFEDGPEPPAPEPLDEYDEPSESEDEEADRDDASVHLLYDSGHESESDDGGPSVVQEERAEFAVFDEVEPEAEAPESADAIALQSSRSGLAKLTASFSRIIGHESLETMRSDDDDALAEPEALREDSETSPDIEETSDEQPQEEVSETADETLLETDPIADAPSDEPETEDAAVAERLADWLSEARETAAQSKDADSRSRAALYAALGQAYDFSIAAAEHPEAYEALLEAADLKVQARAPMTPIVKLVFGIDYDKTRLTEFAAALSHAHREGLPRGSFEAYVAEVDGGLKALVAAERRRKRGDRPDPAPDRLDRARAALRAREAMTLDALGGNEEYALVLVRRDDSGAHAPVARVLDGKLVDRAILSAAR